MKKIYSCLILGLLLHNFAYSQWQKVNFPSGCSVLSLANKNDTLFAATKLGIYKSVNNGLNWTPTAPGVSASDNPYGNNIQIVKNNVYILNKGKLFVSKNNGDIWNQIMVKDSISHISGKNDSSLYLTSINGFLSLTEGKTKCDTLLHGISVNAVITHGKKLYAATTTKALISSIDDGKNWKSAGSIFDTLGEAYAITTIGQDIYVSVNNPKNNRNGLFISSDSGSTWQQTFNNTNYFSIQRLYGVDDTLYAYFYTSNLKIAGVYKSGDKGQTWKLYLNTIRFKTMVTTGNNLFFCYDGRSSSMGGGVLSRAKTNDTTFHELTTGLPYKTGASRILSVGQNMYLATLNNGIFVSNNNGDSWLPLNNGLECFSKVLNIKAVGNTLVTHIEIESGVDYVYILENNKWKILNNLPQYFEVYKLNTSPNTIFVTTFNRGSCMSKDLGKTWTKINEPASNNDLTINLVINDSTIYGTSYGKIYKSNDEGKTWTKITISYDNSGDNNNSLTLWPAGSNIFKRADNVNFSISTNDGNTWTTPVSGIPSGFTGRGIDINNNKLFIAIKSSSYEATITDLYYSNNYGTNWTKIDTLPKSSYLQVNHNGYLFINNKYANTDDFLYRKQAQDYTTGIESFTYDYSKINLYPNPNQGIFTLKNSDGYDLAIYDSFGKKILSTIVQSNNQVIDISNSKNGIYLYVITKNGKAVSNGKILKN